MSTEKKITPLKAIREYCLDCCCGSAHEVRLCAAKDCLLYKFRLGKNPNRSRELTAKQKAALVERLTEGRAQQAVIASDEEDDDEDS